METMKRGTAGWVARLVASLAGALVVLMLAGILAILLLSQGMMSRAYAGVEKNGDWQPVLARTPGGVAVALVPAGCFTMGSTEAEVAAFLAACQAGGGTATCEPDWFTREQPAREVCFDAPFWIDVYEVTNAQFAQFAGTARLPSMWQTADRPRERIAWQEAADFCAQRGAALPTEEQWEYAARGPDRATFPWGDLMNRDCAVMALGYGASTAPVGSRACGASWVGALDLTGNVWEWTADAYASYATGEPLTPSDPALGQSRVARGGSWSYAYFLTFRAATRHDLSATTRLDTLGFRCVQAFGG